MTDLTSQVDKIISEKRLFLIAGPCVAESQELLISVAEPLTEICQRLDIPLIFKSSFSKANRLSGDSYSGPGLEEGLGYLAEIKSRFGLPILTDVHETGEIELVAEVADILQIPAFLCRQTQLIRQAAKTGKWINIKKGQFLAPEDMAPLVKKADSQRVMVTERGASFGYRNLVIDFRSLPIMAQTGAPVIFDATHSLQLPGAAGGVSGGQPQYSASMARAAVAVGVDGLFIETHPQPSAALSDAGAMLPLNQIETLLTQALRVREAVADSHSKDESE